MQTSIVCSHGICKNQLLIIISMIIFTIAGFNNSASAQNIDSLKNIYSTQTIIRYGSYFKKGGDKLQFADLKHEFQPSSVAFDLYTKASQNRTTAKIMAGLGLVATVAALSFAAKNNTKGFWVSLGAEVGLLVASGSLSRRSSEQLDQALYLRNKELLFR